MGGRHGRARRIADYTRKGACWRWEVAIATTVRNRAAFVTFSVAYDTSLDSRLSFIVRRL